MQNMENTDKRLLSISEASKELGLHPDTLRRLEKKGLLQPIRIGTRKDRRYRQEDIEKIIKQGV